MARTHALLGAHKEASYWNPLEEGRVQCVLCPHECRIPAGQSGICRARANVDGRLCALHYGRASAIHLDPIEKKPLFHFHPGKLILSLGSLGCNLACRFCQNWQISREEVGTRALCPRDAVALAQTRPDCIGLAYTYNEPLIWYEYVLDTARAARQAGLKNVLVTNGYINPEPLRELLPFIDALNVDIKAMSSDFYRQLCKAQAEPPRRTVEMAARGGVLVEVTNLVIPGWNDSDEDLQVLVDWLAGVDPQIPLHLSRYHPDYEMTEAPTPIATLQRARTIASRKLAYVYLGNMPGEGENTLCAACGATAVRRVGFSVLGVAVRDGRCMACGEPVPIVGL